MLTIAIIVSLAIVFGLMLTCVAVAVTGDQRRHRVEMGRVEGDLCSSLRRLRAGQEVRS